MSALPVAPAPAPLVTYQALLRALSTPRFKAYSLDGDADSVDAVARYIWNLEIAAALWPTFHLAEVTFRNTLYTAGERTTAKRTLRYGSIPCWLDAADATPGSRPSLLEAGEARDVADAVVRLGKAPGRRTPGHLIGRLGFGFWVRLCNAPYEQGKQQGPQLWPRATSGFPGCPTRQRNRADLRVAFDGLREFRNEVAHHQPAWDRDPVRWNARAIELIGWMNNGLARAAAHVSLVEAIVRAGPGVHRTLAASLVSVYT